METPGLTPDEAARSWVLGIGQGAEHASRIAEYQVPQALRLAEVTWSPPENRSGKISEPAWVRPISTGCITWGSVSVSPAADYVNGYICAGMSIWMVIHCTTGPFRDRVPPLLRTH